MHMQNLIFCAGWLFLFVGCLNNSARTRGNSNGYPIENRYLGQSDQKIIQSLGQPNEIHTTKAGGLVGEIRTPVREAASKYGTDVRVREFVYQRTNAVLFLWLVVTNEDDWVVISDVEVPDEVTY